MCPVPPRNDSPSSLEAMAGGTHEIVPVPMAGATQQIVPVPMAGGTQQIVPVVMAGGTHEIVPGRGRSRPALVRASDRDEPSDRNGYLMRSSAASRTTNHAACDPAGSASLRVLSATITALPFAGLM